jgi:hypothetical protein
MLPVIVTFETAVPEPELEVAYPVIVPCWTKIITMEKRNTAENTKIHLFSFFIFFSRINREYKYLNIMLLHLNKKKLSTASLSRRILPTWNNHKQQ